MPNDVYKMDQDLAASPVDMKKKDGKKGKSTAATVKKTSKPAIKKEPTEKPPKKRAKVFKVNKDRSEAIRLEIEGDRVYEMSGHSMVKLIEEALEHRKFC